MNCGSAAGRRAEGGPGGGPAAGEHRVLVGRRNQRQARLKQRRGAEHRHAGAHAQHLQPRRQRLLQPVM